MTGAVLAPHLEADGSGGRVEYSGAQQLRPDGRTGRRTKAGRAICQRGCPSTTALAVPSRHDGAGTGREVRSSSGMTQSGPGSATRLLVSMSGCCNEGESLRINGVVPRDDGTSAQDVVRPSSHLRRDRREWGGRRIGEVFTMMIARSTQWSAFDVSSAGCHEGSTARIR